MLIYTDETYAIYIFMNYICIRIRDHMHDQYINIYIYFNYASMQIQKIIQQLIILL